MRPEIWELTSTVSTGWSSPVAVTAWVRVPRVTLTVVKETGAYSLL